MEISQHITSLQRNDQHIIFALDYLMGIRIGIKDNMYKV